MCFEPAETCPGALPEAEQPPVGPTESLQLVSTSHRLPFHTPTGPAGHG